MEDIVSVLNIAISYLFASTEDKPEEFRIIETAVDKAVSEMSDKLKNLLLSR